MGAPSTASGSGVAVALSSLSGRASLNDLTAHPVQDRNIMSLDLDALITGAKGRQ